MIKADTLRILTLLTRHYQDEMKSKEPLKEKDLTMHRLSKAFKYIDEQYKEKLTLEQVASSCHMSSNYFSSYFRKGSKYEF